MTPATIIRALRNVLPADVAMVQHFETASTDAAIAFRRNGEDLAVEVQMNGRRNMTACVNVYSGEGDDWGCTHGRITRDANAIAAQVLAALTSA